MSDRETIQKLLMSSSSIRLNRKVKTYLNVIKKLFKISRNLQNMVLPDFVATQDPLETLIIVCNYNGPDDA